MNMTFRPLTSAPFDESSGARPSLCEAAKGADATARRLREHTTVILYGRWYGRV